MPDIIHLLINAFWAGLAALGFGILFRIPQRVILTVFGLGFLAGFIKFWSLAHNYNIVIATFLAALSVGILAIPLAKRVAKPTIVFIIPAVIPMIPGYFAYQVILNIQKFIFHFETNSHLTYLNHIFYNGFMTLMILFAISIGVSLPMLIVGKDMTRKLKE
jgi:uncharacterized membrane protein YjjB (DUF3815 family)